MIVGTLCLKIIIRDSFSLKDKRRVLKSLKDRVQNKYNVSIAEVGANDSHQQSILGIALVGNNTKFINSVLSQIRNFINAFGPVETIDCAQECFSN